MSDERGPLDFDPDEGAGPRRDAPQPPSGGGPRRRFGWLFPVIVLVTLGYISVNILRTEGTGARGVPAGKALPPFAAPLATGSVVGDANIATRPDQGGRGTRPACEVRGRQILNSCQLTERGPLVLAFLSTKGGECKRELDLLERVRRSPGARGVQVAAVAIRGERAALRREILRRGWRFPVGHDRDGAVASLYGISVCPTITYAYPGGVALRSRVGFIDQRTLAADVRALVAASRARGWVPPR